jgi:tetratricopeptide (TPR) repeat protein
MSRAWWTKAPWLLVALIVTMAPLAVAQQRNTGGARPSGNAAASTSGDAGAAASDAAATPTPGVSAVPANVCVPDDRRNAAMACPNASGRMGARGSTAPPAAARADLSDRGKAKGAKTKGQNDLFQLDSRTMLRRQGLQRQAEDLLRREIQLTAQLARSMNRNDGNRPNTLMRLAENLQELSSTLNGRGQDLNEEIFRATQARNQQQVQALQRQQQQFFTEARQQREQLTRVFETLVADHANYNRMDAVLFYLAFAYQEGRNMDRARQIYLLLIQRFPQSQYVPNAYLSFAEFFFEQGDMDSAGQFYTQVIAVNTPENNVRGYAMYKMAWVEFNRQRFEQSLQQFFNVIDFGRSQPDNRSVQPLLVSARNELVSAYGAVYGSARPLNTGQALNTFRRYAADENGAFAMLEKLGELYQDNGQWPNSIAVFHELQSQRADNDRFCHWQGQVAKAYVAMNQRDNMMRELTRLVDVYDQYRAGTSRRSQEAKNSCRDATARVTYDVASHWHLEAIGRSAEGQVQTRGTRDPQTMARAAQLYNLILEKFTDLDQVTFPDYDRRDWPTRYRIAYYAADILRDQGNFADCGPAYDRVVEMNPTGEYTEDAAYKAVLCYNDQFTRELATQSRQRPARATARTGAGARQPAPEENATRFAPRDFNRQETGMFGAFTRYVCYASAAMRAQGANRPPVPEGEDDPRQIVLTIKYRRAYLYYAANKFEEASTMFRDIALPANDDPSREAADPENLREIAADLYLDTLVVMGQRWTPSRPACFDSMERDLPAIKERFCSASARAQHEEFCGRMDLLGCQILRKKAESLGTSRRFEEAGRAYVVIVRDHPECRAREDARADEMLYNAAIMFDSANMLGRAMRVRDSLVSIFLPRNSPWAQRALYRLGGNYHAIQVFGRAADYYERYAEYVYANRAVATQADSDALQHAADALRQATIFRIGLGEEQKALDNAQKFARYFGTEERFRRQAASVVFSIGQIYQDRAERFARDQTLSADDRRDRSRGAWRDVIRHYTQFVNRYARQGTLDQQIQGNVALGRGYLKIEDNTNAQLYFRAAVAAWGEVATNADGSRAGDGRTAGETRIREQLASAGDAAIAEAIERTKDSAAEARFWLADFVYQRFMSRRPPNFRGGNTRGAFDTWTRTTLTPYITQQRTNLESEATQQFQQVIAMHVPNWEIAAAARLADMFYQFARIIRQAPMPPDWQRQGEPYETLRAEYGAMIDERTQPLVDLAKRGYQACITRATSVRWFNEWSQLCERNLNEIDRVNFPLTEEIRTQPNLLFSRASNARVVFTMQAEDESGESGAPDTQAPATGGAAAGGGR